MLNYSVAELRINQLVTDTEKNKPKKRDLKKSRLARRLIVVFLLPL